MKKYPVRCEGLKSSLLPDGFLVIVNESDQSAITLNGTAAAVWEFCDGEHDAEDIADAIAEIAIGENRQQLLLHIQQLLDELSRDGLITFAEGDQPRQ